MLITFAVIGTNSITGTGSMEPLAAIISRESLVGNRKRDCLVAREFSFWSETKINSPALCYKADESADESKK
jgi:hypothetical protein